MLRRSTLVCVGVLVLMDDDETGPITVKLQPEDPPREHKSAPLVSMQHDVIISAVNCNLPVGTSHQSNVVKGFVVIAYRYCNCLFGVTVNLHSSIHLASLSIEHDYNLWSASWGVACFFVWRARTAPSNSSVSIRCTSIQCPRTPWINIGSG